MMFANKPEVTVHNSGGVAHHLGGGVGVGHLHVHLGLVEAAVCGGVHQ